MFRPCFSQIAVVCVVAVVPLSPVLAAVEVDKPVVLVQVEPHFEALVQQAIAPVIRTAQVLDEGDVLQLFRRLRPVIQEALGTQGYFAAEVLRQSASAEEPLSLVVQVKAGPAFLVKSLSLEFEGGVAASSFDARRARLLQNWTLNQGDVFQQGDWASSKEAVLRDLLAVDFAAARLVDSQALVDPDDHSVTLRAVFDSGPVFTFGELAIQGLKKLRPDLLARYNTIEPGDRYELERLLAFQAELQGTSYFSSVDVRVELDEQTPERVPIQVALSESDSKRLSFGGGYSSNTGFRTEASYQFNNLFDRAYHLTSAVRVEQKRQSAYADLFLPPSQKGVENSIGVAVDHQAISNLEVDRTSFGAVRQYTDGPTDVRVGLNFQLEDRRAEGVNFGGVQALVPSMSWSRNQLDDRLNPREGYLAFTQVAGASEALASTQSFVRLYGKLQSFWSPSKQDVFSSRVEWGTVLASAQRDIPQDYLFRSGGSNSVRGFNFMDLGVRDQGVLVGGRRVLVGSAEYTRWVQPQVGVAVFSDCGAVSDQWRTLNPEVALGMGVRYKTPAGAIALDLAKAASQNRPRIHFALGVEF